MLIKKFDSCQEIIAGDNCFLRELLSPNKEQVQNRYSLAWAKVPVGAKTWLHTMKTNEVYFILKGKGKMFINNESEEVGQYDTIYIPSNSPQCLENIGEEELEFLCLVDPAWKKDDEVVLN